MPRQTDDLGVSLTPPLRPKGEVVWAHATTQERLMGLCDVGNRLKTMRPDLSLMLTWEEEMRPTQLPEGCDIPLGVLTIEQPNDVRAFLDHWQPDLCVWAGGRMRRLLMRQLRDRDVPALLIDIDVEELPGRASRWLPDQRHRLLNGFSEILVPNPEVADRLQRAGVAPARIRTLGRLYQSTSPPNCNDEELTRLQAHFGSRPLWLAARLSLTELQPILNAHRAALRLLHRLVLVLTVDTFEDLDAARRALRNTGLSFADWDTGEDPDDHTQVVIGLTEDLGLWYRLCPVVFLGNSLIRGAQGSSPLDAAALGSAIIHGPGVVSHARAYDRLAASDAAVRIYGEEDLAESVLRLSSPDQAAEMAFAGWQVVTEGAAMTDALLEKVQDILDQNEARHASA
ncbi:3-deoxy-D-manno-octulosonic acid transferase [Tritonibacter horizontis]|uniref:3-deoxy-D-manno-octulosonic acid transferase n=1 Tax=Tritonibacter horizontis TaxID=1768241 RepID=A0A132C334_9RHOB|nr:glycosyltransferase N-terminal domain-containing protein [Tritonibacter horizontis]KUP95018.1 3-deoxy-D-manno-octulosonic acid transferase [Tritonibacter horizontis]